MYWSEKEKKFYDSELDYCFGNDRKTPRVTYRGEFDGLVDVSMPVQKQSKKTNNLSTYDDIFD